MSTFIVNRTKERPLCANITSLVMLLVHSIPHSIFGSESDPDTREINWEMIQIFI